MMNTLRGILLTLALLLAVTAPMMLGGELTAVEASDAAVAKDPPCPAADVSSLQPALVLGNQSCLQISLGSLTPGSIVSIDIDISGTSIDILTFAANSIDAYLNNQAYRSSTFWESDASLESMIGQNEWHWQVPTDRSETTWYLILDNLAHPGDGGEGAQGGADANITVSITFPTMSYWSLTDSLHVLSPGSHVALLTPSELTLDEGTLVSITAIPLAGSGDLFLVTENNRDTYLMGGGGVYWVPGTEMLSISSPTNNTWIVTSDMAGESLYLFLDNEAGPDGGGDGSTELRITVSVTITPVLNPVISSADTLDSVDVGEEVGFDVNMTPNLSQQADLTETEWDFDGDTIVDATGIFTTTSWSSPGTRNVSATIHGVDGRSTTASVPVTVTDQTNPSPSILGSNIWHRDVGSNFTLTSTSTDNWMIQREEWRVDGLLAAAYTQANSEFTHFLNETGNHTVELTVVDGAGNAAATVVTIVVRDGTIPVVSEIIGEDSTIAGEEVSFTVSATDPESPTLTYSWDFDKETDADDDGDSTNDIQATGPSVKWTFNSAKPTYVTCTVQNEAGFNKTVEHLIDVNPSASSASTSSFSVPGGLWTALVLVLLLVVAGGGYLLWGRRQEKLALEAIALQEGGQEEEEGPEPERDEQMAMYASQDSQLVGRAGASAEIAAIAGVTASSATLLSDDLLEAFGAEETSPQAAAVEEDSVLDDLDFLRKREVKEADPEPEAAQPTESAAPTQSEGRKAQRSSGISLPGTVGAAPAASQPKPAAKATEERASVQPTAESPSPPAAEQPASADSADEGVTTVKAACPACDQAFAVDMPNEIEEAMVACPNCEQRIKLQR